MPRRSEPDRERAKSSIPRGRLSDEILSVLGGRALSRSREDMMAASEIRREVEKRVMGGSVHLPAVLRALKRLKSRGLIKTEKEGFSKPRKGPGRWGTRYAITEKGLGEMAAPLVQTLKDTIELLFLEDLSEEGALDKTTAENLVWILGNTVPYPLRGGRWIIPAKDARGRARASWSQFTKALESTFLDQSSGGRRGMRVMAALWFLYHLYLIMNVHKEAVKDLEVLVKIARTSPLAKTLVGPIEAALKFRAPKEPY